MKQFPSSLGRPNSLRTQHPINIQDPKFLFLVVMMMMMMMMRRRRRRRSREVLCKCCLLPQEMYLSQPFDLFEYISSIDQ